MTHINITDDDLSLNQQGHLSDRQRQQVRVQRLVWIAGTVGFAGIIITLIAIIILKFSLPTFANRNELLIIIPLLLFWLWLVRHMPVRWHQTNRDLNAGQVAIIEGAVQTDVDFGIGLFRSVRYNIYVNGRSFRTSQTWQRSFIPGSTYRIYHTPHAHQFLGALALTKLPKTMDNLPILVEPLTQREQETLQLMAAGLSNKQIATQLSLSVNTIKMYSSQLYQKLGVSRRTEAVARARELHLL